MLTTFTIALSISFLASLKVIGQVIVLTNIKLIFPVGFPFLTYSNIKNTSVDKTEQDKGYTC